MSVQPGERCSPWHVPLQYGASMQLDFPEFVRVKKMVAGKSRIFRESQETHGAVLW